MSNTEYYFFDSHSHNHDGMFACEGKYVLVMNEGLDDLLTYLYNMYNSMHIDFSMQFEILPISISTLHHSFPERDPLQKKFYKMDEPSSIIDGEKQCRKRYMRKYMSRKRENAQFKTEERCKDALAKKLKRKNPEVLENERKKNTTGRKLKRQCIDVQEKEREMDKIARKVKRQTPEVLEKERTKTTTGRKLKRQCIIKS